MRLHPDSRTILELEGRWEPPAELTAQVARQMEARRLREFGAPPEPVAAVEQVTIAAGHGTVPATVYTPAGGDPAGLLVYVPGGGWMTGTPELVDPQARALANAAGCAVVSVGCRLAPEHRFPAAVQDAYAALCWAAGRSDTVVVGGPSSGGNIAAAAVLMARDRGGPRPAGQLLMYPAAARDLDTASRRDYADGYGLTPAALRWFWDHYLRSDRDATGRYASPLLADDLAGLPATAVLTAECDILRDEGEQYAVRLAAAGVAVATRRVDGMLHGFLGTGAVVAAVRPAVDWLGTQLRRIVSDDKGGTTWT